MKRASLAVTVRFALSACLLVSPFARADGESTSAVEPASERPRFVEQGADDLSSPFTRSRVLMLNAIVARSLSVVRTYDREIEGLRARLAGAMREGAGAAARADARAARADVEALAASSRRAMRDMRSAEAELLTGKEKYNDALFAAMLRFVGDVDAEIGAERRRMGGIEPR